MSETTNSKEEPVHPLHVGIATSLSREFRDNPTRIVLVNRRNVNGFGHGPVETGRSDLAIHCHIGRVRPSVGDLKRLNPNIIFLDIGNNRKEHDEYEDDHRLAVEIRAELPNTKLVLTTCECNLERIVELTSLGQVLVGVHGISDDTGDLVVAIVEAWREPMPTTPGF